MISKYKTHLEWKKYRPKDWSSAFNRGYLLKICETMGWPNPKIRGKLKPPGHWKNKENVLAEAKKYDTRSKWSKNSSSSYSSAKKYGWFEEAVSHMEMLQRDAGYWTKERCIEDAKKYTIRRDWKHTKLSGYHAARVSRWLDECCEHMELGCNPRGYWTIEKCIEEARKYKSRYEWQLGHTGSNGAAHRNGWVDQCCEHMEKKSKPAGHWDNKERCIEEASKYGARTEFYKNAHGAYQAAKRHGWYEECCTHMISNRVPMGHWQIKENVLSEARKYKSKTEWKRGSGSSEHTARINGWFEECVAHMKKK